MAESTTETPCIFCQIARGAASTQLIHQDDKVVAFLDIHLAAFRHYLVIPIKHIPTVHHLQTRAQDYCLVTHMLDVGKSLLQQDAPQSNEHRFGFHVPPFNSIYHLHLHCLALPFMQSWRSTRYSALTPEGGGFIRAEELLEIIKPSSCVIN